MDKSLVKQELDLDLSIVKEEYGVQRLPAQEVKFSRVKPLLSLPSRSPLLKGIQHKCSVCGKSFLNSSQLSIHQKTHSSLGALGDFNCPDCSRTFRFQQSLDEHRLRVHSSKPATKAEQSQVSPTVLPKPMRINPQATKKSPADVEMNFLRVYECDKCEKKFKTKSAIRMHIRLIHDGLKPEFSTRQANRYRPYCCYQCKKTFCHKDELTNHILKHIHSYECPKCDEKYDKKHEIFKHLQIYHIKDLTCNFCERKFTQVGGFWKHFESHTAVVVPCEPDAEALACKPCGKTFESILKLNQHVKNRKQIPCDLCGQQIYEILRKKHVRSVHGISGPLRRKTKPTLTIPTRCNDCGKEFFGKLRYENHSCIQDRLKFILKQETQVKLEKFDDSENFGGVLAAEFAVGEVLSRDFKPTTPEMPFECEVCWKRFRSRVAIQAHIHKSHEQVDPYKVLTRDTEGLFQCDICLKKMPFSVLLEHLKQEGRTVFPCKHCGGLFSTLFDLKRHKALKREGAETLPCPQCPRRFFFRENLKSHIGMSHRVNEETNCMCEICGAKFTSYTKQSNHMKKHKLKILECQECGKMFRGKTSLNRHIGVIHFGIPLSDFTGQKHTCGQCGKICYNRPLLERHLLRHNTVRHAQCPYCSKTYKDKTPLMVHIRRKHREVVGRLQGQSTETTGVIKSEQSSEYADCVKTELIELPELLELSQVIKKEIDAVEVKTEYDC